MKKTVKKKTAGRKTLADMRPHSAIMLDGPDRAPSRAMLYPTGFKKADFKKPIIGIASTWSNVTPCNMHIDELARESEAGANKAGGKAIVFNTITISDGISMGTEGMKYSLVSREVIADSIETVVGCECMDGYVAIGGCDKNMPGCMIAIARMNRPAVFVYGGTILPGCITGESKKHDIVSVFEAVGAHSNNKITDKGLEDITSCAIPGPGSCGGMYTANTMATAIEALGMSLPYSSSSPADSKEKLDECACIGDAVLNLLKHDQKVGTMRRHDHLVNIPKYLKPDTQGATATVSAVRARSRPAGAFRLAPVGSTAPLPAPLLVGGVGCLLVLALHAYGSPVIECT